MLRTGNGNVREFAIPWSASRGGGIPASFLFFGYLTSSGGYVYGQAPNDNGGAFIGTSCRVHAILLGQQYRKRRQHAAVLATSSLPASAASEKAAFYHNTFDPFYRSPAAR